VYETSVKIGNRKIKINSINGNLNHLPSPLLDLARYETEAGLLLPSVRPIQAKKGGWKNVRME
jgi:hypothetical protein